MTDFPREAAKLLLSSMYKHRHPDRRRASFMFAKPGQHRLAGGFGTEVNFDGAGLTASALQVQKHGAPYLLGLPVSKVESDLMSFIIESYYILAPETFLRNFSSSYADSISAATADGVVAALAASRFFVEPRLTAIFPLVPIKVAEDYVSLPFYLCAPGGLASALGADAAGFGIVEDAFPPIAEWAGKREPTTSWLGVRAPTIEAARKVRAVVLGAIALLPHHDERYMFSGRRQFGGEITFSDQYSMSFGDPHTPPLMTDLVIGPADRQWLDELARKLASRTNEDRKHLRALAYYYRAWAPDPVKRFPIMFAAIDALFGEVGQATQAVVDAVTPVMGADYTAERVRVMLGLRASVVHGGAPNVYESSKYQTYYRKCGKDAIKDMELIAVHCLKQVIFPGTMLQREHTYAAAILRDTGRVV